MSQSTPRVTIGLPVYNGENYLAETLDSLLDQSYTDFELIISDNASTDSTEAICRRYAAQDARIRYYRSEQNHGAAWNYNRVFELATGEYFKWAAHDDLCAPTFLERCVAVLEQNPDVVLAFARTQAINDKGEVIDEYASKPNGMSPSVYKRFYEFVVVPHPCVSVFGLIRRDVLAKTKLIGRYTASDRPLLGELSLRGKLYEIPEFLFFYRNHAAQSWAQPSYHAQQAWYDPRRKGVRTFPHWRLLGEHAHSIVRVPLKVHERIECTVCMGWWVRTRWRYLANNLILRDAYHPTN
jgi:glycosyltransferase involved in cell wall biosynthesis